MDITLNLFHDNGFLRHCINDDPAETCDFSICFEDAFRVFGCRIPGINDPFPQEIKIRISDKKFEKAMEVDTHDLLNGRAYVQNELFHVVSRTIRFVEKHFGNSPRLYVSFSVSK